VNPIGRHIFQGPTGTEVAIEVVGVVATGRYRSLAEEPQPFFYLPVDQQRVTTAAVFARGAGGTAAMQRIVRDEVRALDANVPVRTAPLGRTIDLLLTPQRIAATAIGAFGVVGLLLAGIGIYGLVAYTAAQRAREVGVRIALGAERLPVMMMFMRQGAALMLVGSAIGLVIAFAAGRLLTALLHGVSSADPLTFIAVPLLLAAVALFAAYLPARSASRTDPMIVLRSD
jgi:putative ABC transport system permease protein